MSYLFFMDESGHDHQSMPYEVRGGIVVHDTKVWSLIQAVHSAEYDCFGDELLRYGIEIKGSKLLGSQKYKWALQDGLMDTATRRSLAKRFLYRGTQKQDQKPTYREFTAYGQACILFGRRILELLESHDAHVFATAILRSTTGPSTTESEEFLRKDHVYMLERFFYFLEDRNEQGILVFDESEKKKDRKFVRRLQNYYTRTHKGRQRSSRVIPVPLFVSSDMATGVQIADVCIYAINWGYRVPGVGFDKSVRPEIRDDCSDLIRKMVYECDAESDNGQVHTWSIKFVGEPYTGTKKKAKPSNLHCE